MIIKDMYGAINLLNLGFQIIINQEDLKKLKEQFGFDEDDFWIYETENVFYIKEK